MRIPSRARATLYRVKFGGVKTAALVVSTLFFHLVPLQVSHQIVSVDNHPAHRIVILIGQQAAAFEGVARKLLPNERVVVIAAAQAELDDAIHAVQTAAIGPERLLLAAVEHLEQTLEKNGFQAKLLLQYDEVIVISARPVPIDLIDVGGNPLGLLTVVSHVVASDPATLEADLRKLSDAQPIVLNRAALLSIAGLPQSFMRKNHDIIQAALKLSDHIPVDILIGPESQQSLSYFSRKDLQILHVDTHGTSESIQLATRDRHFSLIEEFPTRIQVPFILLVGCSTGSSERSFGPQLVHRGAGAVVGMPFDFVSGYPSGGEISNPAFYDALWEALLNGDTVGSAVLKAKQTLPKSIYSAMWMIFGNADLRFARQQR